MRRNCSSKNGFTIVELLISIAITAFLLSIVLVTTFRVKALLLRSVLKDARIQDIHLALDHVGTHIYELTLNLPKFTPITLNNNVMEITKGSSIPPMRACNQRNQSTNQLLSIQVSGNSFGSSPCEDSEESSNYNIWLNLDPKDYTLMYLQGTNFEPIYFSSFAAKQTQAKIPFLEIVADKSLSLSGTRSFTTGLFALGKKIKIYQIDSDLVEEETTTGVILPILNDVVSIRFLLIDKDGVISSSSDNLDDISALDKVRIELKVIHQDHLIEISRDFVPWKNHL